MYTLNNEYQPDTEVASDFKCSKAKRRNWDQFKLTGGYSLRNEVYLYAQQFVDLWRELVGEEVQPHGKSLVYVYVFRINVSPFDKIMRLNSMYKHCQFYLHPKNVQSRFCKFFVSFKFYRHFILLIRHK